MRSSLTAVPASGQRQKATTSVPVLAAISRSRGRWTKRKSLKTSKMLTVAITNPTAVKLYRKIGFQYCDMDSCERVMVIGF